MAKRQMRNTFLYSISMNEQQNHVSMHFTGFCFRFSEMPLNKPCTVISDMVHLHCLCLALSSRQFYTGFFYNLYCSISDILLVMCIAFVRIYQI